MKKQIYTSAALLLLSFTALEVSAQSKIKDATISGTSSLPRAGSILELESSNKGAMMPRVSLTATTTWGLLGTDSAGMVVYNNNPAMTGTNAAPILSGAIGFYYWDGDRWVGMSAGSGNGDFWRLKGNTGTTPPTTVGTAVGSNNYWGTTDAKNLAVGTNATTRAIFDQNGSLYGGTGTYDAALNPLQSLVWGSNNKDSANYTLVAGQNNTIGNGAYLSFVHGYNNSLVGSTPVAFVYGVNNIANWSGFNVGHSIIVGRSNTVTGYGEAVSSAEVSVSGNNNTLARTGTTVVGGMLNSTYNMHSSAVFGYSNKDSASYTLVAGQSNTIGVSSNSSVALGTNNTVTGTNGGYAIGQNNNLSAEHTTAIGTFNTISIPYSSVMGRSNTITGAGSTSFIIGSGNYNSGSQSVVIGMNDSITNNNAIVLGTNNKASNQFAIALGRDAKANHFGSFVLNQSPLVNLASSANYEYTSCFPNGYKLYTDFSASVGAQLTGTSWASISDRRSKINIKNINYGLATVLKLHPTMYNYKGHKNTSLGFIAQEVKEVVPEVVEKTDMGPNKDYLAIKYTELIPILTKAIQEQQVLIEALQAQNAKLAVQASTAEANNKLVAELSQQVREMQQMLGVKKSIRGSKVAAK